MADFDDNGSMQLDGVNLNSWGVEARRATQDVKNLSRSVQRLLSAWQEGFQALQEQQQSRLDGRTCTRPTPANAPSEVAGRAFSSLLKSYRTFLRRCLHSVGDEPALAGGGSREGIATQLRNAFPAVARRCWTDDEMQMSRAIRWTLDRNDGADNRRLDRWRSRVTIDEGKLSISVVEVLQLYRKLRRNSERLINGVLNHPRYA